MENQGQSHGLVLSWSLRFRPNVQSICSFVVSWQLYHFVIRYSKLDIRPWKYKVKVMAKVKPDGHILGLDFNRYVCFLFLAIGLFLAEILQIPYLTLNIQGQCHNKNRSKSKPVIYRSGQKSKKSKKVFKGYRVNKSLRPASAATVAAVSYEPAQKHEVTLV